MRLSTIAVPLALVGCTAPAPTVTSPDGSTGPGGAVDAGGPPPRLTYFRDVKPIFDRKCNQCHTADGIGPVDLTDPEVVKRWAPAISSVVASGEMPPWHASDECNSYQDNRALTAEQQATIVDWVALGAPMGDAGSDQSTPRSPAGLARIDRTLQPDASHVPARGDEYRCFAIPWPETRPRYVTGYEFEPLNDALVHHVNIFVVSGAGGQARLDRQAAQPGAGFSCFGGQFSEDTLLLGSWVPGTKGFTFPAGTGIRVEPGSVVVLETHFNTDSAEPAPERSSLHVQLEDQVDRRAMIGSFWNFFSWSNGGMSIPAGEADTMHSYSFDPAPFIPMVAPWLTGDTFTIHAVGMHMHHLGTRGTLRLDRYDGKKECLLDIPQWDFNWQSGYFLEETVEFNLRFDKLYLECHWDNTAANQPLIGSQRRDPVDVNWGTSSADEMCIGLFYLSGPPGSGT